MTVGRSFGRLRRNTESAAQSTPYCMVGDEQKQRKKGKRRAVANCGAPEWYLEKITTKWFTSSEGPFILKGISSSSNDDGRRRRLLLAEKVLFSLHHHRIHPSGMDRERRASISISGLHSLPTTTTTATGVTTLPQEDYTYRPLITIYFTPFLFEFGSNFEWICCSVLKNTTKYI